MTLRLYMIAADTTRPLTPAFRGLPPQGIDAAIHVVELERDGLDPDELYGIVRQLADIVHGIAQPIPAAEPEIEILAEDPDAWRAGLES